MRIDTLADLGPVLREERKRRGLTMEDVMFAADVSKTFIIDVESGKPSCQFDRVLRVARAVGVAIEGDVLPSGDDT